MYKKRQPLETNERRLILVESEKFGKVAVIPVGALFVGSIIETYNADNTLNKGDELGYFLFGGSTVVVVFQKDTICPSDEILKNSLSGVETSIKMGEAIGELR